MRAETPRIMLAAPRSSSGKTAVTCAVLEALRSDGVKAAAFKCGPDYIDPMFHSRVLGKASSNLDLFLMGASACRSLLAERSRGAGLSVIEGVMGYYDGLGTTELYSSYHLAKETGTPVVLVVTCSGSAATIAAELCGIAGFRRDSGVKGVILNRIRPAMYDFYKEIVEKNTSLKVFGYLPELEDCRFESRHLGLVTAGEIDDLRGKVAGLAAAAKVSIDLAALRTLALSAPPLDYDERPVEKKFDVTVAVARDRAFCFYYEDGLALLEKLGATLVGFSPLSGELPDCDGLILGGGYPELYLKELSENTRAISGVRRALESGAPCLAECGGFIYLQKSVAGSDGVEYTMAGVLEGRAFMTKRLSRFGYTELTAKRDNLLCEAGEKLAAHEFHYSDSTFCGDAFAAQKPNSNKKYDCVAAGPTLFAGYPHINFLGCPGAAVRFLSACQKYRDKNLRKGALE